MIDVIAIVGPTASGKTALSLELAKRFDGEIINGDSMQVYRGMSIGTAKISLEEMQGVPHHLLDIKEPEESFSVAEYQSLVRSTIEEIKSRGKMPIVVGGTGLYVQAVLFDYRFTEGQVDENVRAALYKELEQHGPQYMHDRLMAQDPKSDIHPNNTRRVIRALEILESGEQQADRSLALAPMYNELIIGLDIDRAVLYRRINERVDVMLERGLLAEVEALRDRGIRDTQAIQAIGYREIYGFLDGMVDFGEAVNQLKRNSRRYAKRQFTYFKNKLPIVWLDALADTEKNIREIETFMQENNRGRRIQRIEEKNKD